MNKTILFILFIYLFIFFTTNTVEEKDRNWFDESNNKQNLNCSLQLKSDRYFFKE